MRFPRSIFVSRWWRIYGLHKFKELYQDYLLPRSKMYLDRFNTLCKFQRQLRGCSKLIFFYLAATHSFKIKTKRIAQYCIQNIRVKCCIVYTKRKTGEDASKYAVDCAYALRHTTQLLVVVVVPSL